MEQIQSQVQQGRGAIQFQLRLPDDLKTRIEDAARDNGRSINSEIVASLLRVFPVMAPEAKGAVNLLEYIKAADDDLEQSTRIAEAEALLKVASPRVHVSAAPDGSISITLRP